ncbi:hypothetical protein OOU_Y34scaffold00551g2 [Pyricularia oryzae Y34]|uniref:Reverse transcriptase domain-containing protein n=2 Tax=Pyricularia oryzae TaxID=318829 RepID=A0AA97PKL4_PYRO3|nr:hypothetical protein OOU_Y34scaffold00551g2 [Pyricularia oryzae Y34]
MLELVYGTELTGPTVVGRYFNLIAQAYEPNRSDARGGRELTRWVEGSGMEFTGEIGVPTHRAGGVLDMVFSNIPFAITRVAEELHTGSDHQTLKTNLPTKGNALIAGGTAPNKRGRSAPWWIRDCQNLWAKYRTARRAPGPRAGRTQEEKDYITGIRRAKADYWRRTIDEITDDKGLWDVEAKIQWDTAVSAEEAEKSCIGVQSTSPGTDGITVRLLTACWTVLSEPVRKLYQRCLELSWYPRPWKRAEVVMLPKAEMALAEGKAVTIVTSDVQGAFDALLPKRLIKEMRAMGFDIRLLRLVDHFLADRQARIRLEAATTEYSSLECGTPQGSPASPVLYMVYLAVLVKAGGRWRFAYADDILNWRASPSVRQNVEELQNAMGEMYRSGAEHKITFAPEKTEMIHITRSRTEKDVVMQINDKTIQPITTVPDTSAISAVPGLRWLGFWFDKRLSGRRRVDERSTKAMVVARDLRSLAGVKHGPL